MDREQYQLYNKIYDNLVERFVSSRKMKQPDKYEREDAFMSAIMNIEKGNDDYNSFKNSFKFVHDIELSKMIFKSAYSLCKGFK